MADSPIARTLYRTGHTGTAAAARAEAEALQQAARDHAETATVTGLTEGDIVVRPLRDPTEPPPSSPPRWAPGAPRNS
ncbi:hypothetical protein N7U49_03740 [Streptomyces sp. AD2-2]|nr:hypothetical protein N7U49_03740 [Streptomyces sp. AD2-2]